MPTASSSRVVGKGREERIGVKIPDQRRQHAVGNICQQPDVVTLERFQHHLVPSLLMRPCRAVSCEACSWEAGSCSFGGDAGPSAGAIEFSIALRRRSPAA